MDAMLLITQLLVYEPVTFLTDVMVSLFCWFFVRRLSGTSDTVALSWRYFFLFMGTSTFLGGTVHGFFPFHDTLSGQLIWGFSHLLASIALFFAQSSVINTYRQKKKKLHAVVKLLMYGQLVMTFISIVVIHNFTVMIVSLAIGYIPVLIYYIRKAMQHDVSAFWIATGIFLSLSTGFVFLSKFSFCEWFNFNDISHLILMMGFSAIYKGLKLSGVLLVTDAAVE
jgi:hypothetical protein